MHETSERGASGGCGQCRELLPWYVAGTLAPPDRDFVADHIVTCTDCASELALWLGFAQTVAAEGQVVQPAISVAESWERFSVLLNGTAQEQAISTVAAVNVDSMPATLPVARVAGVIVADLAAAGGHFWRVLAAQARLLQRGMWVASALGVALAALYAALVPSVSAGDVLTFALPLIAASGAAFLYGPESDPALELALGTPTSARAVLFGRFLLLFGYDTALALAATTFVAAARGGSIWMLASLWFGPMALLSSVSLALSLLVTPVVAGGLAVGLWFSRMLHFDDGASLRLTTALLWHTSPQILVISLGLLLVAFLYTPRQGRLASEEQLT